MALDFLKDATNMERSVVREDGAFCLGRCALIANGAQAEVFGGPAGASLANTTESESRGRWFCESFR
jgi:hypothetical protein